MHRPSVRTVCLALVCVTCALGASANPAPAPSAFNPFPIDGVSIAPPAFSSGQLMYTLELSWDAYLLFNSVQYPITLIWGFYAVNTTGSSANDFIAAGPDIGEWGWDQHPQQGSALDVAGWLDSPKNEAMQRPASGSVSKQFTYSQLQFTGEAPVLGLHVSVSIPDGKPSPFGSGLTGAIIPIPAPEPSSLLALILGAAGLAEALRRGRR